MALNVFNQWYLATITCTAAWIDLEERWETHYEISENIFLHSINLDSSPEALKVKKKMYSSSPLMVAVMTEYPASWAQIWMSTPFFEESRVIFDGFTVATSGKSGFKKTNVWFSVAPLKWINRKNNLCICR